MKSSRSRSFLQRQLRSLVRRTGVSAADASGGYAVQHLPEWMAKTSFDFARWRRLWVEQNPRNDRADLARLVMFLENARLVEREGIAGSIALAIILVPIVARITEEMMLLVPRSIREASYALGAPRWRTVLRIVFPTALPGIITGIMLALSRICGEAAPLLFTALGNQFTTADITAPMDSLPRRIYVYATGPYDYWHEQAWAMSLILVSVILVISLVIRTLFGARVVVRQ